jgi:GxxExxY protein
VYNILGPGLFESVYESALHYELPKLYLKVQRQLGIKIPYDKIHLKVAFKGDLKDLFCSK